MNIGFLYVTEIVYKIIYTDRDKCFLRDYYPDNFLTTMYLVPILSARTYTNSFCLEFNNGFAVHAGSTMCTVV